MPEEYEVKLKVDTSAAMANAVSYIWTLSACLRLAKRLGLPPNITAGIRLMQRLIRTATQLRMAYLALATAEAMTVMGTIRFGVGMAGAVIDMTTLSDVS